MASLGKNFRLPQDVRPTRYRADLAPDLGQGRFDGRMDIELSLARPRKEIVLHAIEGEHFAPHGLGLLRVVCGLVHPHGCFVQEQAHFAVRKLGGEIVGPLFHGGWIGVRRHHFVSVEFGLRLGLRRTFAHLRWRLRGRSLTTWRRLSRRWRILRRALAVGLGTGSDR